MSFEDKTKKLLDISLSTFGETKKVKYLPKSGGTFFIRGIFDESWKELDPGTEITLSSRQPNLGISKSELKGLGVTPKQGDKLEARDCLFKIVDIQEDGQDGIDLFLHKVD